MRWIPFLIAMAMVMSAAGGFVYAAESAASQPAGESAGTLLPIPAEMVKDIPPARARDEVVPLLGKTEGETKPVHIVLVAGPKDHGPGEHDYPAWQKAWKNLLEKSPRTRVTTAWEKPSADDFKNADVLVLFKHFAWPKEVNEQIDAYFARGGGMVLLHFAVDSGDNADSVGKYLGLHWAAGAKFRHGWLDLCMEDKPDQAYLRAAAGKKLRFHDETYWRLTGDAAKLNVLATSMEDDGDGMIRIPLIWNHQVGKGRVHVNILGHYSWTFNDPIFRVLVLRGIAWAGGQPIDRFNSLATVDVKLAD